MTHQPAIQNFLTPILEYVRERERAGKGVDRICASLERLRANELDTLGAEKPERVIELVEVGYSVLLAQACGDRPDNDAINERYESLATVPSAKSGRSDPTARQAGKLVDLQRVNGKLRQIAMRHGILLRGDEQPSLASELHESVERCLENGWTVKQIQDELALFGATVLGIVKHRREVERRQQAACKVCLSPHRGLVEEMLRDGAPVREIEERLCGAGENISDSTINRHRRH